MIRSILCTLIIILVACNSDYTLKQRGYFRIDFPKHEYQKYDQPGSPYSFEYPVYAKIVRDTTFFEAKPENDYWINIDFPEFFGKIYISYKEIKKNNFDSLVSDAFKMTYKHTSKATEIRDSPNSDSLGVVNSFLEEDMKHLINTLQLK